MIKVKDLKKIYKSKNKKQCIALDNVSFTLPDTGLVYVIGKSGSGKSTLLNLIAGLDTITSGSINIDGNEVGNMSSKDFDAFRSSYLTFVFQDYKLFENLTIYQNIEVGLDVNDSVDQEVIRNSLKRVGLSDYEKRYPYELSGGQQQRVAIARALSRNSKLILADEPTGNLDFNTSRQILAVLKEISKEKLIILVSHNLMDADIYADRIIELHEGHIISDKTKRTGYTNSFKIENDKIILPHYINLNIVQKEKMFNALKSDEIKEVIQNDNGFTDTIYNPEMTNEITFLSKKAKNRSLLKILKMFFKKRIHIRVIMIIFSVLLFTVLSILQSFIMFEPNASKVNKDEDVVLLYKGNTIPFEESLRSCSLFGITDNEYQEIVNVSENTTVYKLNNYYLPYTSRPMTAVKTTLPLYTYDEFYVNSSHGTLVCDEEFVSKLFFDKEELEVIIEASEYKPYGITITDYAADALIHFEKASSYEDIIGMFKFSSVSEFYINSIIKTDYLEKYSSLQKIYDDIEDEESFYNVLNDTPLLQEFIKDLERKYNIAYSFNPNFEKDLITAKVKVHTYVSHGFFESGEYYYQMSEYSGSYLFYSDIADQADNVEKGEIVLTPALYNKIFGTMYTVKNYDLSVNNTFKLSLYSKINGKEVIIYSKEFKIVKLSSTIKVDEEDFDELIKEQIVDFGLVFENNKDANDIIKYGNNHGFYLKTIAFESGVVINKMTSTFNTLFLIILICIYIVFGIYIIIYGVNTVRYNKEEIGIYKALGGKFRNISKVLFIDVIITGILISVISLFITPLIINICDDVIVDSFKNVLHLAAVDLEVIKIYPAVLSINYSLLNVLIIISSVVPTLLLMKLKPIEIIKK